MKLKPFSLERYFAKYEFSARFLLSCSDCEPLSLSHLLSMADAGTTRLWEDLALGYTESTGHPLLREAIAGLYEGIEPDRVLVMAPEEGIFLSMHALLEPGDHVVCVAPAYQSLHEVARSIGCEVSDWLPDENEGWRFDLNKLEALIRDDTKLVVVNFPHNPTGSLPSQSDFEAMIDLVSRRGIHLFSDEMYRFLECGSGATLPSACESYERAISLFGLSKTFGLPGLRIGWIVTRDDEILAKTAGLKDYTTICNGAPSEILSLIALRNRAAIIAQQNDRVRRNLTVLDAFFDEHSDRFRWNRPAGGSICFPRMTGVEDTETFCEKLVAETGIMLAPSSRFLYGHRHVRIGFGRENLPEALERLSEYLHNNQETTG